MMKIKLTFLTLIMIMGGIQAQTDVVKEKKINYSLFFNPNYSNRILNAASSERAYADQRNEIEIGNIGYSVGFHVEGKINSRWSIISGLSFSDRGYRTKKEGLSWSSNDSNLPVEAFSSFHYNYFDLSLAVKYNLILKDKFSFFLAGGTNFSLYVRYLQNSHVRTGDNWSVDKDILLVIGSDRFNVIPFFQAGWEFPLFRKISLGLAINGQMAIKGTNSNIPTKEYLYSIGPEVSFIWNRSGLTN